MRVFVLGSVVVGLFAGVFLVGYELSAKEPPVSNRLMFEKGLGDFIAAMDIADKCGSVQFEDATVDRVIEQAGSTFFPGIRNISARSRYKDVLRQSIPGSKLRRDGGFSVSDCAVSRDAAELALWSLDNKLELAGKQR